MDQTWNAALSCTSEQNADLSPRIREVVLVHTPQSSDSARPGPRRKLTGLENALSPCGDQTKELLQQPHALGGTAALSWSVFIQWHQCILYLTAFLFLHADFIQVGRLTHAGPPCCWRSGSERAHRQTRPTGTPPRRTGRLEIWAAWGTWAEAKRGEPSRWMPSRGRWNWARAQTEAPSTYHQKAPVWRSWLEWRETLGHRSPGGETCWRD